MPHSGGPTGPSLLNRWRHLGTTVGGATKMDPIQGTNDLHPHVKYEVNRTRGCQVIVRTERESGHTHRQTDRHTEVYTPPSKEAGHN